MENLSFAEEGTSAASYRQEWIEFQDNLKQKLVLEDDFTWTMSPKGFCLDQTGKAKRLQYIGGVDVSFVKDDPSLACGALVVLDASTLNVLHEEFEVVRLEVPYLPGFLAFREAPVILRILEKMKQKAHPLYPQLLMVDGNGILHPRGFGLACQIGVLSNLPTIGIGKNLHHVDGLTKSRVRQLLEARKNFAMDIIPLVGESGQALGAATRHGPSTPVSAAGTGLVGSSKQGSLLPSSGEPTSGVRRAHFRRPASPLPASGEPTSSVRRAHFRRPTLLGLVMAMHSTSDSIRPIYVSPGHRISIDSSIKIVKLCCKFRVPEPIRQADIRSRLFLQKLKG